MSDPCYWYPCDRASLRNSFHCLEHHRLANRTAPEVITDFIKENIRGLHKIRMARMERRGQYQGIGALVLRGLEAPLEPILGALNAEELTRQVMEAIRDDFGWESKRGIYKVTLIGPPGPGRFERSKHIDMETV